MSHTESEDQGSKGMLSSGERMFWQHDVQMLKIKGESIGIIIMNNLGQRKDIRITFITASCALRSMLAMKRSLFQLQISQ